MRYKKCERKEKNYLKEEVMLLKVNKAKPLFFLSSVELNRFFQSLLSNVWDVARLNDKHNAYMELLYYLLH